jgi:hypothetical protein
VPGDCTCNPSYLGGWAQEDNSSRPAWLNNSQDPHLQNNLSKMGWRYGSHGRVPALLVWSSEFKPSPTPFPPKKEKIIWFYSILKIDEIYFCYFFFTSLINELLTLKEFFKQVFPCWLGHFHNINHYIFLLALRFFFGFLLKFCWHIIVVQGYTVVFLHVLTTYLS